MKSFFKILTKLTLLLLIAITLTGSFYMLEYSSQPKANHILQMTPTIILLNLLTIGFVWFILFMIVNRIWLASLICSVFCGIIAIVNHFVLLFHNMPLSFLTLRNFKTAMNVINGYSLPLDATVRILVIINSIIAFLCLLSFFFIKEPRNGVRKRLIYNIPILATISITLYFCYCGPSPLKPQQTVGWLWSEGYWNYGYATCTVESFHTSINCVSKPEGYSENKIAKINLPVIDTVNNTKPDVILILNESFYDLKLVTEFETDFPYMSQIKSLDNLLSGYAIVPSSGGGTNYSEYELLTSNSMYLLPAATPFNTLNLNEANSIVAHMNALGYHTIGAHSESGSNYSRTVAYNSLGFDQTFFDKDFNCTSTYCDRIYETDESLYKNMIHWYEAAPKDMPRFFYLLTIQNHGGYELSADEYDTVHVKQDFGDLTDDVNEFLTSIRLSDYAFKNLTDYFLTVDRPVIICMVGDHSPKFSTTLPTSGYDNEELDLIHRKVPFFIWANYSLEQHDLGTISLNYIIPTLLDVANIPKNPYYSYQLDLKNQIPIITSYGKYYDNLGNSYIFSDNSQIPNHAKINEYFHLEYYNIMSSVKESLLTLK